MIRRLPIGSNSKYAIHLWHNPSDAERGKVAYVEKMKCEKSLVTRQMTPEERIKYGLPPI